LEKVREITGKLWLHKEKVLLVVLLGVLIVQVWRGWAESTGNNDPPPVFPPQGPKGVPVARLDPAFKARIVDAFEEVKRVHLPPAPLPEMPVAKLIEDNPFSIWRGSPPPDEEETPDIVVRTVRPGRDGGPPTASLIINGNRVFCEEGEEKDGYRVEEIDVEAGSVTVFSESHGKSFTYTRQ
jgi:hypothetical protein